MKRWLFFTAFFAAALASTSFGLNIAVSGTSQTGNQAIIDFFVNNFNATVTFGDFSNPANIPAGTDVFVVGRVLYSGAYANADNSAIFNALDIPVACFTSYVARPDGGRWGWHSGGIGAFHSLSGNETVVTEEGAKVFGTSGPVDWWNDATWGFSAPGTGSVGEGKILATSPAGEIVVAYWKANSLSGSGVVFGSKRLLFNVPDQGSGNPADLPNTEAGRKALLDAFKFFLSPEGAYDPVVTPQNPDGSVGVLISQTQAELTLNFKAAPDPNTLNNPPFPVHLKVRGHYIYLSGANDTNLSLLDFVPQVHHPDPYQTNPNVSYGPITLTQGAHYQWQVEEAMDDGKGGYCPPGDPNNILGQVWTFRTIGVKPTIISGPEHALADFSGNASFTIVPGPMATHYRWFKVGTPDIQLTDGGIYSGTQTTTLVLTGATVADEGLYYCIAYNGDPDNGGVPSDPSPQAKLWYPRLVSYYPFDELNEGVSPDVVGGFDAVMMQAGNAPLPGLNTTDAIVGSGCLALSNPVSDSTDDQYAQIPAGVVDYRDLTISLWVRPTSLFGWSRVFDFGNGTNDYLFLTADAGWGVMRFAQRVGGGTEQLLETPSIPAGQWTHVAVTITGNTGRLYRNGELVATNTAMTINPIDVGAVLNYLGKSQWPDPEFDGLIDDLKIYNYARTTEQIAQDYLAVRGEWVCNREIGTLPYDFNNDCQVDIADLALFLEEWMDSWRIYP
jgi:hypothetical protein